MTSGGHDPRTDDSHADAAAVTPARTTRDLILGGSFGDSRAMADDPVLLHPHFRYTPRPCLILGCIVATVRTVFDAMFTTHGFEDAVAWAVSRGGDADTIDAVPGQLADARHGSDDSPAGRLNRLDSLVAEERPAF